MTPPRPPPCEQVGSSDETMIAAVGFSGEIHPPQGQHYTYLPHPDLNPGSGINGEWTNSQCCQALDDSVYDRYTLVRLNVEGQQLTVEDLDGVVGAISQVVTITPLDNADGHAWEMLVEREHIRDLRQLLHQRYPSSLLDSQYNPLEPSQDAVELLGLEQATQQCIEKFRERVGRIRENHWYIGGAYYEHYLALSGTG